MDFMKVFEETVREIKREVNLKVLKVPEIEQKVLDATNNEAWGPHGSALAEIARETNKFTECQIIMNVLWTRLTDTGANWRHVYKALTVIEYLVANGSDRAVDDIIEHSYQISSLSGFEYVEPNGKDMGINVRKKVETILGLLNDREKIKAVRDKAASTRDKYVGLSSTGISYKSSSASFGGSNFHQNDPYGSLSGSRESETFKNSYKDKSVLGEETETRQNNKDMLGRSRDSHPGYKTDSKSKKGTTSYRESSHTDAQKSNNEDEFDDFDPRGSSTIGSAAQSFNQVDLFGDSLIDDLMNAPAFVQGESTASKMGNTSEVDLFADADFVSVPPCCNESTDPLTQDGVDLFASQCAKTASSSSNLDLFSAPHSTMEPSLCKQTIGSNFDPFAKVPLNTFEESDLFGAFTSHTDTGNSVAFQSSVSDSANKTGHPALSSNQPPKKDPFQVKSGIWADSLSRGLIDLNISAPNKTSLAEVGVVGGLNYSSQDKEKGPTTSGYKGTALSMGTGPSRSVLSSMGESGGGSFSALGNGSKFQ